MDQPLSERHITNSQGLNLFCRYFRPDSVRYPIPRAVILYLHGYAEYFGTDDAVIDGLLDAGFLVFGHDHVGHGKSEGTRGQIKNVDTYVRDVLIHIDKVRGSLPDVPFFILGHSMGGAIALLAGIEKPNICQGMILIGPMIVGNPETATPTKRFLAKIFSKLTPNLGLANINNDDLCRDRAVVDRFNTDELIFRGKLSVETAHVLLCAADRIVDNMERITWPLLCIHGDTDRICDVRGAEVLLEKAASVDKTVSIYPGSYHRVHNEPNNVGTKCVNEVISWINARIPSGNN
ncbi:monoglyceride lipase-like [Paramacrobiotus metropolitanus]|uniref:monoglyceride lipase-like n=1 Tax=Paramacrobiotus metropolitanus TaxID=2943436 RepID=UPI002445833B|nr:monoglyceride lipase-like [Paramacrobiotus metropolitanus]XP_055353332.1 monoglyceride lipase-like [Paramacrobiotus metropolitanus]